MDSKQANSLTSTSKFNKEKSELDTVGFELAFICHYYPAYKLSDLASLRREEINYLLAGISRIQGYENYQMAQLEATILNVMGGKGDGSKAGASYKQFRAEERLAYFADMGFTETASQLACEVIKSNVSGVPSWAMDIVDWGRVNNANQVDIPLLGSTYQYMGEPVIVIAGYGIEYDDDGNPQSFGGDLILVHPALTQDEYKVELDGEYVRFNLPERMVMLSEPKVFHMQSLPLIKYDRHGVI